MVIKKFPYEILSTGSKWAYRFGNLTRNGFVTCDEAEEAAKVELAKNKSGKSDAPFPTPVER